MDNIAKNPGKYLKGDDMVALAMNAGKEAQIDATAKAAQHAAAHGFSEEATERIATKFGQNAAEKAVGETAQNLTASGLKESTEKITSRVASRTAQNVAEETVEGAAKGATKNSGLIAKFCNWVGKKIGELFGNSKIVGWIKNSKIGKKMAGKSIEEVNNICELQKSIVANSEQESMQAKINHALHIETILNNDQNSQSINIKNVNNTRRKERNKNHIDYMKEGAI